MGVPGASDVGHMGALRSAWSRAAGAPPDLPGALGPDALADDAALAEALGYDAHERTRRSLPATLEEYARGLPGLLDRREPCRAVLMHEFATRVGAGEQGVRADLERRLPALAEEIALVADLCALVSDSIDGPPEPPPARAGETMGKYTLIARLGAGAFGEVWHAWDTELHRGVALKLLFASARDGDAEALDRVMREARAAAALDHEHIVAVHSAGRLEPGRRHFIDSQLVADHAPDESDTRRVRVGASLEAHALKDGAPTLGPRECARIMEAVCAAVASAHAHGVLHRDLKPGNILVTPSGKPMVADFGLSTMGLTTRSTPADARATGTVVIDAPGGRIVGTPAYMSPEQAAGALATPLSDVYALGATLRFLLTGQPPFAPSKRFSEDARWDVIEQVRQSPAPPVCVATRGVPATLGAICDRAMAKRPEDRYLSADHMGEDLRNWMRSRPTTARPVGPLARARLWTRRHRVPALVAFAGAAALAAIGVKYVLDVSRERDRAVEAEGLAQARLMDAQTAEGVARAVNEFMQRVLGAADPRQAGKDVTVLSALGLASEKVDKDLAGQPAVEAGVRTMIGRTHRTLGDTEKASGHLERALALWNGLGGEDRPEAIRALHELALLRFEQRRIDESVATLERVVELRTAVLPPDHEETLTAINDLATMYRNANRLDDAARTFERSVVARERAFGPDHPRTIAARRGLATVYFTQGHPEKAEAIIRTAVQGLRRTLGDSAIETLLAINDLGVVLRSQKRAADAEPLLREAYTGYRAALPRGHVDVQSAGANLVGALRDIERAEDGLVVAREMLADAQESEIGRARVPLCLAHVGGCLADLGRYEEARDALTPACEGLTATAGDKGRTAQSVLNLLVKVHTELGEPDKAEAYRARLTPPAAPPTPSATPAKGGG